MSCKHQVCEKCEEEKVLAETANKINKEIKKFSASYHHHVFIKIMAVFPIFLGFLFLLAPRELNMMSVVFAIIVFLAGTIIYTFWCIKHHEYMQRKFYSLHPEKAEIMRKAGWMIPS